MKIPFLAFSFQLIIQSTWKCVSQLQIHETITQISKQFIRKTSCIFLQLSSPNLFSNFIFYLALLGSVGWQ